MRDEVTICERSININVSDGDLLICPLMLRILTSSKEQFYLVLHLQHKLNSL